MEVLTTECGGFHATSPDPSPNDSPASTSPIPEHQISPRNNILPGEQSLHVIVEPQFDGPANYIYLTNPVTGQILSTFIAEHGSHIEIQPGVLFRVPYPNEHVPYGNPYGTPQLPPQPQELPYSYPNLTHAGNMNGATMHANADGVPWYQYNPQCPLHGSPGNANPQYSNRDEKLNSRKEKLQKKLRDKKINQGRCTCSVTIPNHTNNQNMSGYMQQELTEQNGCENDEPIIIITPKVTALSPYSIEVAWHESISNTSYVNVYQFELQQVLKGNQSKTVYNGVETLHTIKELQPGTEYSYRLRVSLNGRDGPFSEVVSCKTYCCAPARPQPPRITQKSKKSLTLKWTAPQDGGSPITQYKLQWKRGTGSAPFNDLYVGVQKQYKHCHNLPPATPFFFKLQAANAIGVSEFSQVLECLTSPTPPGLPDRPTAVRCGTDFIELAWKEPETHGSVVEEYKLEMEDPNNGYGFMVKYNGEQTSFTCNNLRRNTGYKFRLLATNSIGSSKYSSPVIYSTLPDLPGKMEKPKVNGKVKSFSIPIKWELPKDNGGDEIAGFILEMDDGKGGPYTRVYHGPDRECIIDQLTPGATYSFRVASESKAGVGKFSPSANITTLPVCPKDVQPPGLSTSCKPEMCSLYLEWDPPLDPGGAFISNYIVKMTPSLQQEFQEIYRGPNRTCMVLDLEPGTEYFFKTQAVNSAGASPWSSISTVCTAPGPPDAPLLPTVTFKSPTNIRFDWNEPKLHGSEISGYCVEKLESETFQKVYQGTCAYCEIKRNIEPASTYYFRIQALSAAGASPYSNITTVETPAAPPSPVNDIKVIEQTSNSCLVQWCHPLENGSPIYEYVLEATGATSLLCTVQRTKPSPNDRLEEEKNDEKSKTDFDNSYNASDESDSDTDEADTLSSSYAASESSASTNSRGSYDDLMEYRLTGLTADASYKLRIQGVNQIGAGPFSHAVQFFTKELPPPPPTLNSSTTSYYSIKLKWGDSSNKSINILNHTLQVQTKSGSFTTVFNGVGSSFTMNKLKELTPYCCRIRSRNDAGEGEFSKPKTFYTKAQPPQVIKDLRAKNVQSNSLQLVWSPCEKIRQDDSVEYIVQQLHQENSKDISEVYRGKESKITVNDLQPDQLYRYRVYAIRHLSKTARTNIPNSCEEVKGVSSAVCRIKTLQEALMDQSVDESTELVVEESQTLSRLTDTHIALIILGTFLGVCALVAGLLKWVLKEFN